MGLLGLSLWLCMYSWGFAQVPPSPPYTVSVWPVTDLRKPDRPTWLSLYLQETLAAAFRRSGQVGVLGNETSALWQRKLARPAETPLTSEEVLATSAEVIVRAHLQGVLGRTEFRLSAQGATGAELLPGPARAPLRLDLRSNPPQSVLEQLSDTLLETLLPGTRAELPRQPARWEDAEALYTLLATPVNAAQRGAVEERQRALLRLADVPGLSGRAHEALAELLLLHALSNAGEARVSRTPHKDLLEQALTQIELAMAADPRDTDRLALKGEIHYFLDDEYQAKTSASIARIKNPANGLAFAVLALTAGLSTGQGTEHLKRALRADPFLKQSNRPTGAPPFQQGVLEPLLQKWEELRSERALPAPQGDLEQLLAQGQTHFDAERWEEANEAYQQAAKLDGYDHRPWLQQYRIMIRTDQAHEAVPLLRVLSAEHPQQPDVSIALAWALSEAGETEPARVLLQRVLTLEPEHQEALLRLAQNSLAADKAAAAMVPLRQLLALEPEHVEGWLALARTQVKLGQTEAARSAYERLLELKPGHETATAELEKLR